MLILKDIHKEYPAGDTKVPALRGVSVEFRKSEFVSILGPSGCGKTTLLNIIGGLDKYTSGDLVIDGRSTKDFRDADWDAYRNHSIGFVFQSYNLIPHQSVLSNVELALTISGISKAERRRRAKEALTKVGLASEIHKRPNQMSGGQMQRVAIARALVNDPEILLADEPTGALDSETSVQIMEMLKEVAKDRLVIMVTHNPELAETYSTRIIRILDGKITSDTNPYTAPVAEKTEETAEKKPKKKEKRLKNRSMSFFTALALSMNNLRTKKGRTLLTSFAGSIGIIGIALILAISNGVTVFINRVQEDTLSSYPITIQAETADMSSVVTAMMGANTGDGVLAHEKDAVYANRVMYDLLNSLSNVEVQKNNLTAFKKYLDGNEELKDYVTAVDYSYNMDFHIFTKDTGGRIIKSDVETLMRELMQMPADGSTQAPSGGMGMGAGASAGMFATYTVWQEMLAGEDGELVNALFDEQYELVYGDYPENYNEIVLIVDGNNEISDIVLYSLGLKTTEEMKADLSASMRGENTDKPAESWSYEEICGKTFKLILPCDFYQKNGDGTYTDLSLTETGMNFLYNSDRAVELKVAGIIRPNEDAVASMMSGSIGYTSALSEYAIRKTAESEIVKAQLSDAETDILSGLPFKTEGAELSDGEKAEKIRAYFATLSHAEKAAIFTKIQATPDPAMFEAQADEFLASQTIESLREMVLRQYAEEMGVTDTEQLKGFIDAMSDEELTAAVKSALVERMATEYAMRVETELGAMTADALAAMFDAAVYTEAQYAGFYDLYMPAVYSESTQEKNLKLLGYVDEDAPSSISIYASTFEDKDEIARIIEEYNESVHEADKITYTDYVALLMSSVTVVINAISYVLIAFVSVSLVVSSIMIGIITYISVLERTKEIGILRAIGASKKDISRVFNAETVIVGFISGAIGILFTLLAILVANPILHAVSGLNSLNAILPWGAALILVALSIALTLIAGVVPSRMAAKKDPVVALRTE